MERRRRSRYLPTVILATILTFSATIQTNLIPINSSGASQVSSVTDPVNDLIYIYTKQTVPPAGYLNYVDITGVVVENKTNNLWCTIGIVQGPPVNLQNTIFYTFMFDENNDPTDNCKNYPTQDVDITYTVIYTKTGGWTIERAKYQVVGEWWMVEDTDAHYGLASSLPGGFSVSMSIPLTELPDLSGSLPWKVKTETFTYPTSFPPTGDFAPDEGLAYLGMQLTCDVHTGKLTYYIGEMITIYYSVSEACDFGGMTLHMPDGSTTMYDFFYGIPLGLHNLTASAGNTIGRGDVLFQAGKSGGPTANATCEFYVAEVLPPKPYITHPTNCSLICGNSTEITVVEMNLATNVIKCAFEYAPTVIGPWQLIALDTSSIDGWRTSWDLTSLSEGNYYLRATMINNVGQFGEDLARVYFDPMPPMPRITAPTFPTFVSGVTDIVANDTSKDIVCTEWWVSKDSWKACTLYTKNVTILNQHGLGTDDDDNACGSTAAACCLAYWDNYTDQKGDRPYRDLYDETKQDGLKGMARDLFKKCNTNLGGLGTSPDNLKKGINDYIGSKKLGGKLEAKFIARKGSTGQSWWDKPEEVVENIVEKLIKDFLRCQDVLICFETHVVTMSSIHFENLKKDAKEPGEIPPCAKIKIDYMDPWTGKIEEGTVDMKANKIDGPVAGQSGEHLVDYLVTVCPKDPEWIPIGTDIDGSDGWNIQWNTTQLPDAFYLVEAIMTDATGNAGEDFMLVYVNNARVANINSTKTVVSGNYTAAVQVSVENLFAGSAAFNITMNCNETLIGTTSVTLASQTSTRLNFTWNTTDMPNGNYTISIDASVLLDGRYLSRVTYMGGWMVRAILGDINGDRRVNILDISTVAKAFQARPGDPRWDLNADMNNDRIINIVDITIVAKEFGKTY